jgi:hypothetical protein
MRKNSKLLFSFLAKERIKNSETKKIETKELTSLLDLTPRASSPRVVSD